MLNHFDLFLELEEKATNYYYVLLIIKIMYAYSRLLYGNHSSASAVHQNLSAVVVIEVVLLAFLEPKQLFYG